MLIERRFLSIQLNGINSEKVNSTSRDILCSVGCVVYTPEEKGVLNTHKGENPRLNVL